MDPWVYVVLLGIAVMVYAILQPNRSGGKDGASIGEFEEALDRFADVMEEDNRELLETVNGWRRDLEAEIHRLGGRMDALEKQFARFADAPASPPAEADGRERTATEPDALQPEGAPAPSAESPDVQTSAGAPEAGKTGPERETAEEVAEDGPEAAPGRETPASAGKAVARDIRSRYPELFAWHDAGKSVEYIAKKSGMNKGEVLLILQLAKREEQHRA